MNYEKYKEEIQDVLKHNNVDECLISEDGQIFLNDSVGKSSAANYGRLAGVKIDLVDSKGKIKDDESDVDAKAKEKTDSDAKAKEKADADAKAKEKTDADAKAKEKADADAKAKEKADADAKAKEKADAKAKK